MLKIKTFLAFLAAFMFSGFAAAADPDLSLLTDKISFANVMVALMAVAALIVALDALWAGAKRVIGAVKSVAR